MPFQTVDFLGHAPKVDYSEIGDFFNFGRQGRAQDLANAMAAMKNEQEPERFRTTNKHRILQNEMQKILNIQEPDRFASQMSNESLGRIGSRQNIDQSNAMFPNKMAQAGEDLSTKKTLNKYLDESELARIAHIIAGTKGINADTDARNILNEFLPRSEEARIKGRETENVIRREDAREQRAKFLKSMETQDFVNELTKAQTSGQISSNKAKEILNSYLKQSEQSRLKNQGAQTRAIDRETNYYPVQQRSILANRDAQTKGMQISNDTALNDKNEKQRLSSALSQAIQNQSSGQSYGTSTPGAKVISEGDTSRAVLDSVYDNRPDLRSYLESQGLKKKTTTKHDPRTGQTVVTTTYPSGKIEEKVLQTGQSAGDIARAKGIGSANAAIYKDNVSALNELYSKREPLNQLKDMILNDPLTDSVLGPFASRFKKWTGTSAQKNLLEKIRATSADILIKTGQQIKGSLTNREMGWINANKPNTADYLPAFKGKLQALTSLNDVMISRINKANEYMESGMGANAALKRASEETPTDKIIQQAEDSISGDGGFKFKTSFGSRQEAVDYVSKLTPAQRAAWKKQAGG